MLFHIDPKFPLNILDANGRDVVTCFPAAESAANNGMSDEAAGAYAMDLTRRVVACWNYCMALSTETLEADAAPGEAA